MTSQMVNSCYGGFAVVENDRRRRRSQVPFQRPSLDDSPSAGWPGRGAVGIDFAQA